MDEVKIEDLGVCVGCNRPLRAGQVVRLWDDEIGHADCKNPMSLTFPDLGDENPPAVVLIGNPAKYVSVNLLRGATTRPAPSEGLAEQIAAILLGTVNAPEQVIYKVAHDIAALSQQDAMREGLQEIASQPFEYEMDDQTKQDADYLDGYEMCIARARQALGGQP